MCGFLFYFFNYLYSSAIWNWGLVSCSPSYSLNFSSWLWSSKLVNSLLTYEWVVKIFIGYISVFFDLVPGVTEFSFLYRFDWKCFNFLIFLIWYIFDVVVEPSELFLDNVVQVVDFWVSYSSYISYLIHRYLWFDMNSYYFIPQCSDWTSY